MLTYGNCVYSKNGRVSGKKTDVAVIGLISDLGATTRSGQSSGPSLVRRNANISSWIYPRNRFSGLICDTGNVVPSSRNIDEYLEDVAWHVADTAKNTKCVLAIGGDDSVNYGVVKGLIEHHGPISMLHYDAHVDMYGDADESIDHSNWVRHIKKDSDVKIRQFGTRAPSNEYPLDDELGSRPLLISIDMDVLDPSYAPGVACPCPFGISPTELINDALLMSSGMKIVGISVSEIVPARDLNFHTSILASEIVSRILFRCRT